MMTREEHKNVFFNFIKQHPLLADLIYQTDLANINPPRIVRLKVRFLKDDTDDSRTTPPSYRKLRKSVVISDNFVIFDPNYDNLFLSFINTDFNDETVDFIKDAFKVFETKNPKDIINMLLEFVILPLVSANLNTKTLYVVTRDISEWEHEVWDETIVVQGLVEDFLEVKV